MKIPNRIQEELWITNISQTHAVSLGDLRISLGCGKSINLLAKKQNGQSKYSFSRKQIDESIEKGSIYQKQENIKVRMVKPVVFSTRIDIAKELDFNQFRAAKKPTKIEVQDFPDLDFEDGTDEEFAIENAEMDFSDRQPILSIDPKYKIT